MEHSTLTVTQPDSVHQIDQLSQAVVETVAEAEGADPTEITPLYTAIDPDALEALFRPQPSNRSGRLTGEIRFSYHGYRVRVTADGRVDLVGLADR